MRLKRSRFMVLSSENPLSGKKASAFPSGQPTPTPLRRRGIIFIHRSAPRSNEWLSSNFLIVIAGGRRPRGDSPPQCDRLQWPPREPPQRGRQHHDTTELFHASTPSGKCKEQTQRRQIGFVGMSSSWRNWMAS